MPRRVKRTSELNRKSRALTGVRGRSPSKNDKATGELTRSRYSKDRTTVIEPFMKGYETHPVTNKKLKDGIYPKEKKWY